MEFGTAWSIIIISYSAPNILDSEKWPPQHNEEIGSGEAARTLRLGYISGGTIQYINWHGPYNIYCKSSFMQPTPYQAEGRRSLVPPSAPWRPNNSSHWCQLDQGRHSTDFASAQWGSPLAPTPGRVTHTTAKDNNKATFLWFLTFTKYDKIESGTWNQAFDLAIHCFVIFEIGLAYFEMISPVFTKHVFSVLGAEPFVLFQQMGIDCTQSK